MTPLSPSPTATASVPSSSPWRLASGRIPGDLDLDRRERARLIRQTVDAVADRMMRASAVVGHTATDGARTALSHSVAA